MLGSDDKFMCIAISMIISSLKSPTPSDPWLPVPIESSKDQKLLGLVPVTYLPLFEVPGPSRGFSQAGDPRQAA